jgi:hypothetical protein
MHVRRLAHALYQGMALAMPQADKKSAGFSPCCFMR